ncbi:MAG: hypothetical protein P1U63_10810 [Coxiellaceae bacterium]|nr:hypothetical protein [Coxiellaceae bacterium]
MRALNIKALPMNWVKQQRIITWFLPSFSGGFSRDFSLLSTDNPIEEYTSLARHININGPMASMKKQFKPSVELVLQTLESDDVADIVSDPIGKQLLATTQMELFQLGADITVERKTHYPHTPPFTSAYPYIPTLMALINGLSFIDASVRASHTNLLPLYHADRYRYHTNHCLTLPNKKNGRFVYLPLVETTSIYDFIRLRAIPFGIVGVTNRPIFSDGYFNSPLDFAIHDFNHIRRFESYNRMSWKNRAPLSMIKKQHQVIHSVLLPAIKILSTDTRHEKIIKQCMLFLMFELFHEFAFTIDRNQLRAAYDHTSGEGAPFEHFVDDEFNSDQIESRRLPNGNIGSGYAYYNERNTKYNRIRYFMDKSPNFMASCHNKLNSGFYDHKLIGRDSSLPPLLERTEKNIGEAAFRLAGLFFEKNHPYSKEKLIKSAGDKSALETYLNDNLKPILPQR